MINKTANFAQSRWRIKYQNIDSLSTNIFMNKQKFPNHNKDQVFTNFSPHYYMEGVIIDHFRIFLTFDHFLNLQY